MDRQTVYSLSLGFQNDSDDRDSRAHIQQLLFDFVLQFHIDNAFIYRDQIRDNVLAKQYFCDIDIAHIISYNEELAHRLNTEPAEIIPLVWPRMQFARKKTTNDLISSRRP